MIPSRLAFALLGASGLLFVSAFAEPRLVWAGAALDALVLLGFVVDALFARRAALRVERLVPEPLHQGEETRIELRVVNEERRPLTLRLRDALAPELAERPFEKALTLPARSIASEEWVVSPPLRGPATLAPLALRVLGPLRLGWGQLTRGGGERVRVFPRAHLEGEAGLLVRHAMERRLGQNPFATRGLSHELYGVREYLPGDEYRMIHWKAAARFMRPATRETTWEQHQHVVVLLDAGRPMASLDGRYAKLDHAMAAVLALLRVAVAQQDEATLLLFGKEIRRVLRIDRRTRSFGPVFEALHAEEPDGSEPDYARVAAWCAHRIPRRSLVLVVTSVVDLVLAETLGRALRGLARRHLPLLVNLEDPALLATATAEPDEASGAFAKASAMRLLAGNRALTTRLRAEGVDVISVPASDLAIGVIGRYLDFKERRRA